jgi:hypothetical protein
MPWLKFHAAVIEQMGKDWTYETKKEGCSQEKSVSGIAGRFSYEAVLRIMGGELFG